MDQVVRRAPSLAEELQTQSRAFNQRHPGEDSRLVRNAYTTHHPRYPQPPIEEMWLRMSRCNWCKQRYRDLVADQRSFRK